MADTSLDDIIKQRKIRPLVQTARFNSGGKNTGKGNQKLQSNLNKPNMKVMGDMRNKIIQKKRLRMVDARDRLAELAKQVDARDRLNKMRRKNITLKTKMALKNPVPLVKKVRNENRPSNLGGQTQMKGSKLMRTVAGGDVGEKKSGGQRGPPPRATANGRTRDTGRYHPLPNNPHVVTIKNRKGDFSSGQDHGGKTQVAKYPPRPLMQSVGRSMESAYGGRGGMPRGYSPEPEHLYRSRSPLLQDVRPTRLKITTPNNYREQSPMYNDEWDMPGRMQAQRMPPPRLPESPSQRMAVRPGAKKRPMYDDENDRSRVKKLAPLSNELLARLDQPSRAAPQGFKVLVTNLHPCVSVEDMEELFGTIGPIISARMLRQGVAEAIFVTQDDAYRSVEVFNHRQLDGQPMCVSVVGRQTTGAGPTPPTQSSHTTSVLKAARGRSGYYV